MRPIDQQTILITGATDGLGRALAARLAAEGATVLVHGRDDQRGKATLQEIGGRASWYRADLSSVAETRALAEAVRADHPRLDVLVNNAGMAGPPSREESTDGHELTFQVNYLSGYLLTRLLLPTLAAPARIVNVSSLAQQPIDFDDVMLTRGYALCGPTAKASSPKYCSPSTSPKSWQGRASPRTPCTQPASCRRRWSPPPVSTLEEGLEATYRLVTDPALDDVSGRYFDGLEEARADAQAYDPDARARLRDLSERLTAP